MKKIFILTICIFIAFNFKGFERKENKIFINVDGTIKEKMIPIDFDCKKCFLAEMGRYRDREIYLYGEKEKVEEAYAILKENGFNVHIYAFSNSSITYSLGCIFEIKEKPDEIKEIKSYPPHWDWRNAEYNGIIGDWTTSVKSQGNCGSCWDFAAMGALEAIINIREGYPDLDIDLSEQYLLSCPPDSGGCSGWNAYYAYKYIYENGGALPEDCFPYAANDKIPCDEKCEDWKEKLIPIKSYGWYSYPSKDAIKSLIYNHGPVVASMEVYEDFLSYKGGIYRHKSGSYVGGHQVVIVGYDDNQQYWICKNSWGKYWGEDGYFRIAYGECGIENQIIYVDYDANAVNWPPIADIGDVYFGSINEEIQFESHCIDPDGDMLYYEWDFGDGNISNEQNPKHSYNKRGIYKVKLTIKDVEGHIATDEAVVFVDLWREGNTWKYVGDIKGDLDIFFPLYIDGKIFSFKLQVTEDMGDKYKLSFYGRAKLIIRSYLNIMDYNFSVIGKVKNHIFWGDIYLSKGGFGIEKIVLNTRAGLRAIIIPPFIYIPLPFRINANVEFEKPYTLITKYPEVGVGWATPSSNASINAKLTLFFILPMQYSISMLIWSTYFDCVSKEIISVPAGTFEALKIITFDDLLEIYYSMEINNIVKMQTTDELVDFYFDLELESMEEIEK